MDGSYLFSVILPVRGGRHLLPLTLDSLNAQAEKNFEVVLIEGSSEDRLSELTHQYPHLHFQIHHAFSQTPSEMLNEGIRRARGLYVQFLEPGDRLLSQQGLSYVRELIETGKEPHLAYASVLMQGEDAQPEAVVFPLSLEELKRGIAPSLCRSSWFLKKTVEDLGGFDRRFVYRSAFDLLCRLFSQQGIRTVCSRRVLTDGEEHRSCSKETFGTIAETCSILYRYFGFRSTLKWLFVQDFGKLFRSLARLLKGAFRSSDS